MSVEQRLHRAAHDLREMHVDVPTFEPPTSPSRALGRLGSTVAAGFLMAIGAVAVVASGTAIPSTADAPVGASVPSPAAVEVLDEPSLDEPAVDVASAAAPFGQITAALTPLEEVAMIESIGNGRPASNAPVIATDRAGDIPPNAN
ncbi:MAG: hypothetical protein AB8G26_15285 [Ilumatobacter sp.]